MVWDAINVSIHGLSGNVCAICSRPPSPNRKLDRDHDHQTGRARGLLCVSCNKNKVGRLTLEDARAVVAYLERVEAFYANVDRTRP